jgi:aminopeptidase N
MAGFIFSISMFLACTIHAADNIPRHALSVSFDIEESRMQGVSHIALPEDKELKIHTHNLTITSITLNGSPLSVDEKEHVLSINGPGIVAINYEVIFSEKHHEETRENVGVLSSNIISDKGICLTGGWHPSIEGTAQYQLKAILPKGYSAISEADAITAKDTSQGKEYSFDFPYPVHEINFIAGRYKIVKETYQGIDIYGYFFPEDASLAKTYIQHTKKYLEEYQQLLTPYPYKRFSVVENFLPTGYSMPTFTLLGQEVVKLPFIVKTSLGHEILHQWFGNYVYVDYDEGNWVEGLTTYLSDHLYEEQEGTGWKYRKKILTDYESYVGPNKEFPLKAFTGRVDFASKAIGYGKGAMVFHMLKNLVGEPVFYEALKELIRERAFHDASWEDIRTVFEKISGKDLALFFEQWLDRKGVVSIAVRGPRVIFSDGVNKVSFDITQNGQPYSFRLPVKIHSDNGDATKILNIEKQRETFEIPSQGTPTGIILDENYDLMRDLSEAEYPPVISRLLGDEKRLIVVPEKERERYDSLIAVFQREGFTLKEERELKDEDIMSSSLLILGFDGPVVKRLFGSLQRPQQGFTFFVRENPLNSRKVVALAYGDSQQEVDLVSGKIYHYGKYSSLRFRKGRNTEKSIDESNRGIRVRLYEPVTLIQTKELKDLKDITAQIADTPIIYVGERHTNYEDHKIQLEVIMSLHKQGRTFAIGMEMFQKPFQDVLDKYISGTIDEREFLKDTEYFKKWKFDYNLYREIVEFAKAKEIPIIALNLRSEIIDTVSKGGIDALTDEERKEIPEDMDMSDKDYRKRLKVIFMQHERSEIKNFEHFTQSQILWDETMAHTVAQYLNDHPGSQIVVLAGVGHIMYDSGLPKRVFRLNRKDYVTLIPDAVSLDNTVGTYVFFAAPQSPPPSRKLGIILTEKDSRVKIEKISPGSIAEAIGLKEGDILVSMDGWEVGDIADVRIFMVGKKEGETVKIKILRKRFLFGEKEHDFTATL